MHCSRRFLCVDPSPMLPMNDPLIVPIHADSSEFANRTDVQYDAMILVQSINNIAAACPNLQELFSKFKTQLREGGRICVAIRPLDSSNLPLFQAAHETFAKDSLPLHLIEDTLLKAGFRKVQVSTECPSTWVDTLLLLSLSLLIYRLWIEPWVTIYPRAFGTMPFEDVSSPIWALIPTRRSRLGSKNWNKASPRAKPVWSLRMCSTMFVHGNNCDWLREECHCVLPLHAFTPFIVSSRNHLLSNLILWVLDMFREAWMELVCAEGLECVLQWSLKT